MHFQGSLISLGAITYVVTTICFCAGLGDFLYDDTGSSEDEEDDRETGSSDSESCVSIDDIITDLGGGLSLMEKYPVLLNDAPPSSSNSRGKWPSMSA